MNECYYVLDVVLPYPVSVVDASVTDMASFLFPFLPDYPLPTRFCPLPSRPAPFLLPASSKPKLNPPTTVYSPH